MHDGQAIGDERLHVLKLGGDPFGAERAEPLGDHGDAMSRCLIGPPTPHVEHAYVVSIRPCHELRCVPGHPGNRSGPGGLARAEVAHRGSRTRNPGILSGPIDCKWDFRPYLTRCPAARLRVMECAAVREFTGVHNMIRGMFRLMEAAVSKAKPDDAKQLKVLSDFGFFGVQGTRFHHSAEDNYYWPAVERNGADASLLEPLIKEHHMIDPLLDEAQRAFEALEHGPTSEETLDDLKLLVGRFKDNMLSHLDHEEPIFFPLLTKYMPDDESHRLAAEVAKKAPRKGISWLMGGVEYGMTKEQSTEFIATFPKPIQWLRPLLLRKYKSGCGVLGVDPATPSQR